MNPLLCAVFAVIGFSPPDPETGADSLADADVAYVAGLGERADSAKARPHFLRAAAGYERAWASGGRTPAVARNLAQCRLLAGDLGRAIAAYRRGLRLFPHDRDLQRGLAYVRSRVEYPLTGDLAEAARPRDPGGLLTRAPMPFVRLGGLALAIWAVGWFVLARAWVTVRGGWAVGGGGLILAAAGLGGWLAWEDDRLRAHWAEPAAVVLGSGADLRTGNSDEYPKRLDGRLPAGVELKVLGRRGGWLHVDLADGTAGWVPAGRAVEVE